MKRNVAIAVAGLLLFVLSSAPAAAPADNADAVERARASFHHGVQLYNEGSFEAALAEFRRAYQVSPSYRLLYNIAQAYFELHDYVNASKSLKQYIQDGGSEIPPDRRAQVRDLNQKLEERIAYLDIDCNLDGADIRVDDISVGTSPLPALVLVNAGPRRVTAVKAGYAVAARMVTVVGKEKAKVSLDIGSPMADHDLDAKGMPAFLQGEAGPKAHSHAGLIASSIVAGGCAITTAVFGILALNAKSDFNNELARIPNTKGNIDDARSKMKTYAYLSDAFGAATLLSSGAVLYFLLTDNKRPPSNKTSVALAPTLGGLLLQGQW